MIIKSKSFKILFCILNGLATYVAIFVSKSNLLEVNSILSIKCLIALISFTIFYYLFIDEKRQTFSIYVSSIFLSFVMLFGELLDRYETCFPKDVSFVMLVISFYGWFILIVHLLKLIKKLLCNSSNKHIDNVPCINKLDTKKFIVLCMLIMIVCWVPYIILRYPAGIESDAKNQIAQVLGFQPLINRWPVFSSVIMGSFFKLGYALFNSYNVGALLFVIFQVTVSAFVLAYTLKYIKNHNGTNSEILIILFVYSFVPLFPGYITSIVKDVLFTDMVILFNVFLLEILIDGNSIRKGIYIGIASLLMCLLRNNGIYILLFEIIVLFIYMIIKKTNIRYLLLTLIIVVLVNGCYQRIVIPSLGLECDNTVEALSIPLQQTARCLKEHYNGISKEDINTINKVLDVDNILERYNPLLSDPVKETFHGDSKDLIDYLKLWLRMFFKYPATYVDATLQNIYGFFYPNARMWNRPNCGFYTSNDIAGEYLLSNNNNIKQYCDLFENYYINILENIPIVGVINSAGFYMCANVVLIIWLICNKKYKFIIFYMPSIVGILVCIAGPTFAQNGVRYALPVIYLTPLYIWLYRRESINK